MYCFITLKSSFSKGLRGMFGGKFSENKLATEGCASSKHNKTFKERQILSPKERNEWNQPLKAQTTLMQYKTTIELH